MRRKKFPQKTIPRALLYIRTLEHLEREKKDYISSRELAEIIGGTDVQIRKDISSFKKVGKPRVGYKVVELKKVLEKFVQKNTVRVALFGVGHLGTAIVKYPEFHNDKIKIVVAFDPNPKKIGQKINNVQIYNPKEAPRIISKKQIDIGIIATPKECSQGVADLIVSSGPKGIINFSPTSVNVPDNVFVKNIDLSIEFLSLFCDIQKKTG